MLLEKERGTGRPGGIRGEELVESVIRDLESSPLPERDKALLRFVDKVNHQSSSIGAADMQPLHEAGWTDEAVYYAVTVCALFNFYNRWVDASGVPALSDEAHREGARPFAEFGYNRR